MADTGTDIKALDDLPDPEELVSGDDNVAYAQARRLLQPSDAFDEIGETEPFECIDIREAVGKRMSEEERQAFEAEAAAVLAVDERVSIAETDVSINGGEIEISHRADGTDGPFDLVLSVDSVSVSLLRGEE